MLTIRNSEVVRKTNGQSVKPRMNEWGMSWRSEKKLQCECCVL